MGRVTLVASSHPEKQEERGEWGWALLKSDSLDHLLWENGTLTKKSQKASWAAQGLAGMREQKVPSKCWLPTIPNHARTVDTGGKTGPLTTIVPQEQRRMRTALVLSW